MKEDIEQLKVLAIFYYLFALLMALMGMGPFFYAMAGAVMMTGIVAANESGPSSLSGFFPVIWLLILAGPWLMAFLMLIAGMKLSRQRSHAFCMACAVISCIVVPLGTVLGLCAINVLRRHSVRMLFEANAYGR